MSTKTVLWAGATVIGWAGLALLTPDRIGERSWSIIKIPVVLFLAASWFGFVLAIIAQGASAGRRVAPEVADVELSAAVPAGDTLIAAARRGTKSTVLLLGLICATLAVWDGLIRMPPQWLRAGIWTSAAGALVGYLYKLMRCRVALAPSCISWHEFGRTIVREYADVADFRVLSSSGIQILFLDGQKVTITSDMADLKQVLATDVFRNAAVYRQRTGHRDRPRLLRGQVLLGGAREVY